MIFIKQTFLQSNLRHKGSEPIGPNSFLPRYRNLIIVALVGIFFSVGSVISDSAPYNPSLDLRSISWAVITVLNDITVWFLASVLIGWGLATSKRESIILGGVFGFLAMVGYYALLPLTTSVAYEWESVLLISVSLIGGLLASFLGQIARQLPLLLGASTLPLLGDIIFRLLNAISTSSLSVLDIIQIGILAAFAGVVVTMAYRTTLRVR